MERAIPTGVSLVIEAMKIIKDLTVQLAAVAEEFGSRIDATAAIDSAAGSARVIDQAARLQRARMLVEERRTRLKYLPHELFGEPAWDMLLALYLAWHEGQTLFIKSLAARSTSAMTTSQRWIDHIARLGLVDRVVDPADRRRVEVKLSFAGLQAIDGYLASLPHATTD